MGALSVHTHKLLLLPTKVPMEFCAAQALLILPKQVQVTLLVLPGILATGSLAMLQTQA